MSVRVSPISRAAAILIIVLGVFTVRVVNTIAGMAFIALGIILYALLYWFRAKLESKIEEVGKPDA